MPLYIREGQDFAVKEIFLSRGIRYLYASNGPSFIRRTLQIFPTLKFEDADHLQAIAKQIYVIMTEK